MPASLSFFSVVFICSFMVAAPIFGYLGDRFNRKVILSCGIFFWSFVTLLSSFITKDVSHTFFSLRTRYFNYHIIAVLLKPCMYKFGKNTVILK